MSDLEAGCLATVIQSVDGLSVGRVVQCVGIVGEHSQYGVIWQVHSVEPLVSEYGAVGNYMDFPASWLKKIKPPNLPLKTKIKELVD